MLKSNKAESFPSIANLAHLYIYRLKEKKTLMFFANLLVAGIFLCDKQRNILFCSFDKHNSKVIKFDNDKIYPKEITPRYSPFDWNYPNLLLHHPTGTR